MLSLIWIFVLYAILLGTRRIFRTYACSRYGQGYPVGVGFCARHSVECCDNNHQITDGKHCIFYVIAVLSGHCDLKEEMCNKKI